MRFHLAEDGAYELVVRDDGHGCAVPGNLDAPARARHFGLFNARERIHITTLHRPGNQPAERQSARL